MQSHDTNRRLTTILMADVVEYSRLMAADEEGTLARLKAAREDVILPKEQEYNGRTVKLMGDGALMEFGSVRDALKFAVDVQRATIQRNSDLQPSEQIRYRIGINIGDVITEGDDLYGEGINICARLETNCRPDSILLSESAYRQVEKSDVVDFEALGKKKLKNLPEPIAVYQALLEENHPASLKTEPARIKPGRVVAGIGLTLLVVAFLIYAILYPGSTPVNNNGPRTNLPPPEDAEQNHSSAVVSTETTKITIAVLPFENLSGDPEQAYFSDGVSEDIITDLSQLPGTAVIARSSSFSFRNNDAKVQEIGKDLGATHLLQGSIRREADRIRINARLVDTTTGHSLWAERYDGELADVFALQDEITDKIVSALSIQLSDSDKRQINKSDTYSFEAYDLFLKGRQFAIQGSKSAMETAIDIYQQVIELDPNFARAYGALAVELARYSFRGYATTPTENQERAIHLAKRAAAIDPGSPHVQWALGYAYMANKQYDQAIAALEKAVSLSPNYTDGYGLLALIHNNLGNAENAITYALKAMELHPHYTWEYPYLLGRANWILGKYEEAVPLLEDALERNPLALTPGLYLVSTYIQLELNDDAEWIVSELQIQNPDISLSMQRESMPLYKPELRQRLFTDLQTAGLPE